MLTNKKKILIPGIAGLLIAALLGWQFWPVQNDEQIFGTGGTLTLMSTVSSGTGNGTTATVSHTVDAGSNLLVCSAGRTWDSGTLSATFGGTPMDEAVTRALVSATNTRASIFYLANPSITTADVVVTNSPNSVGIGVVCYNFSDADTSDPIGNTGGADGTTAPSVAVTSAAANHYVVDAVVTSHGTDVTMGQGADQTEFAEVAVTAKELNFAASREQGSGSRTMSWSISAATQTTIVAAEINEAPPAPPPAAPKGKNEIMLMSYYFKVENIVTV